MAETSPEPVTTLGAGVRLEVGSGENYATPGTWTPIAQLLTVKLPVATVDEIETTSADQIDLNKKFRPTWKDNGTADFTCHYTPEAQAFLRGLEFKTRAFRVTFNKQANGATKGGIGGQGYLKDLAPNIEVKGLVAIGFKIRASGGIIDIDPVGVAAP